MQVTMPPLFRSDGQARILAALFDRPGRQLTVTELAHAADLSISAAGREVERLARAGIVRTHKVGPTRIVAADEDLPWASYLAGIVAHTVGLPVRIGRAISGIGGIVEAYIFGSWAARQTGEPGPAPNDIDLLVLGGPDPAAVAVAIRPIERELDALINPTYVPVTSWRARATPFIEEVAASPLVEIPLDRSGVGATA